MAGVKRTRIEKRRNEYHELVFSFPILNAIGNIFLELICDHRWKGIREC